MKTARIFLLLLILLPLSVALQDLLPSIPPAQERILLLPVIFCFGALALPLLPALFFALIVALVQGLVLLQIQSGQAEFSLIAPVVFFLSWKILLQMASEATHGMSWELHALSSALVTVTLLGGEFLILCLNRGEVPITMTVVLRTGIPSIISLLIAALLYLLLGSLVPFAPAQIQQLRLDE